MALLFPFKIPSPESVCNPVGSYILNHIYSMVKCDISYGNMQSKIDIGSECLTMQADIKTETQNIFTSKGYLVDIIGDVVCIKWDIYVKTETKKNYNITNTFVQDTIIDAETAHIETTKSKQQIMSAYTSLIVIFITQKIAETKAANQNSIGDCFTIKTIYSKTHIDEIISNVHKLFNDNKYKIKVLEWIPNIDGIYIDISWE